MRNFDAVFKNISLNGKIVDIGCTDGIICYIGALECDGTDFGGRTAYAGLIDIHTHGMGGIDTMDGHLCELSELYAHAGTTSFCPTSLTASSDDLQKLFSLPAPKGYSRSCGFHMEGPYISKNYPGAQNPDHIRDPGDEFDSFENISVITLAPELDGAIDYVRRSSKKAKVCIAHTSADYNTVCKAADAGAVCVSHIFNAMPPLHHREPSVVGAAFDKDMYVQVICDGIHLHPAVVRMLYRLFGSDRMILISDSMRACGLPDGEYDLGGLNINVRNKIARTENGAIAGSTFTLLDCVKKAIEFGIDRSEAFRMASETPAKMLGLKRGILEVGYDCDFIVLDDDMNIVHTVIGGKIIE